MNLSLTGQALSHLHEELDGRILRIAFTTGCGGSGYRLSFESAPNADDTVVTLDDEIRVALDDMAAQKLEGAVIDYTDEADGYTLEHPEAVMAIWCG